MQLAIVTTLIRAQPVLMHWLAHHRALGVQLFYLFVDDPDELPAYAALPLGEGVVLTPHDDALRALWQQTRDWPFHSQFIASQVYSRQCLNTNHAIARARAAGCDWLIHLDIDECLHVPEQLTTLAAYFASKHRFDMVTFVNHEAVPEAWHIGNYFSEVTLFKRNFQVLADAQKSIAMSLFGQRYFLAYANGKSAINLHGAAMEADGAHAFRPAPKLHCEYQLSVLHFSHCGYNWFHQKFAVLGEFDDRLMGFSEITQIFPFLAEGRQSVVRGSIHQATQLYRDQVLQQGGMPHSAAALLTAGVLVRIGESPLQTL